MADNVTVDNGTGTDYIVSTDEGSGGHVQRVKLAYSADGSETHVTADADGLLVNLGSNNDVVAGGVASEDAALSGNPVRTGARAHSAVPTAMSADNDVVTLWADRSGALAVIPQIRYVRTVATPTISTSGYVTGDQVGSSMSFFGAQLALNRAAHVTNVVITSASAINDLELWLFSFNVTLASSDNAAFDISDANLVSGFLAGIVEFPTANWRSTASGAACIGTFMGGKEYIPAMNSGGQTLYGVLVMRSASPTQYTGTSDLVVAIQVNQQ